MSKTANTSSGGVLFRYMTAMAIGIALTIKSTPRKRAGEV